MTQREQFEAWWGEAPTELAPLNSRIQEETLSAWVWSAWQAAQAQAAAQCIGKDPLCPCQDGDTCHYEGKDAWPVPQHFPFMPWSKETEMMESWAQHGAVEPVAWMHDETGLIVRVSDIAKTSYNEPRIKSGEFSPLYASQPDHTKAMRLALEIIRLQREWIMAVPQDTVLPSMPGFDREWVDRQIAALEKELK